jgi:hypothetical protein
MTVTAFRRIETQAQDANAPSVPGTAGNSPKAEILHCRQLLRAGSLSLILFKSPELEWREEARVAILKAANSA